MEIQSLVEQLAEEVSKLETRVKALEKKPEINFPKQDLDRLRDVIIQNLDHQELRIEQIEQLSQEQKVELKDKKKTRIRLKYSWIIFMTLFLLMIWIGIRMNTKINDYQKSYYKYQMMDLYKLNKRNVDQLYLLNPDSLETLVDDSIKVISKRREALEKVQFYEKQIFDLQEEFELKKQD